MHTTLDSCGSAFSRKEPFFSKFQKLMEVTDLVMLDLKQTDSEKHKGTHRAGQRQYFGYGSLLVGDRQADVDPARVGARSDR